MAMAFYLQICLSRTVLERIRIHSKYGVVPNIKRTLTKGFCFAVLARQQQHRSLSTTLSLFVLAMNVNATDPAPAKYIYKNAHSIQPFTTDNVDINNRDTSVNVSFLSDITVVASDV
jgi:hypothetical protein